jgi:hypothetical protein
MIMFSVAINGSLAKVSASVEENNRRFEDTERKVHRTRIWTPQGQVVHEAPG